MEAPRMQVMGSTDATPYAGLFPDGDGDPPIMTDVIIENQKRLGTYHWAVTEPKGVVVLVHGFGEHLGRYFHVANFFVKQGYEVRGMDHVCHGHSEGFRAAYGLLELEVLLESWAQYILQEIVPLQGPHFVYAHSTGGMVTFLSLNRALGTKWDKLLSTYKALEEATRKDPFYFGWKANLSMVETLLNGTVMALQQLKQPKYPFLVMVSPKDQLVDPAAARELFEQAASSTKSFETDAFASCEHEIHNEEDWQKPLKIALQFLQSLEADTL